MNQQSLTLNYEAPSVEIIEVAVEQGFANSGTVIGGTSTEEDMGGGGSTGILPW